MRYLCRDINKGDIYRDMSDIYRDMSDIYRDINKGDEIYAEAWKRISTEI